MNRSRVLGQGGRESLMEQMLQSYQEEERKV